ncbi:MAG: helix-turn-helix domain-containing protein [Caulobacteraceae bacterium]
MPITEDWSGDDLFQSVNRRFDDLPDLLNALMRAFAERAQVVSAQLCVRHIGALVLGRAGREITCDWLNDMSPGASTPGLEGATPPASVDDAVRQAQWRSAPDYNASAPKRRPDQAVSLTLPLTYANAPVGDLQVSLRDDGRQRGLANAAADFARQCGLLIKRCEVQRWAAERLGQPVLLVGLSAPVRALDRFVEKASASTLPVLIRGEFGTEKAQLAAMIHGCGPRRDGPFVQVNCAEPAGAPAHWFDQAEGGTLFLSGVDDLTPSLQRQLPQYMTSRLGQWIGAPMRDLRVIASTTADLSQAVVEDRFSRALLAELDFLSVAVPPLRERPGDIEALVATALTRNGYDARDKATNALMALCRAYPWPENTAELERVVARLAVMTGARPIADADIRRHAPGLVRLPSAAIRGGVVDQLRAGASTATACVSDPPADSCLADPAAIADRWVRCVVTKDAAEMKHLHDGLRRALLYLGKHYADAISLDQLAQQANISPSHLGFLFRTALDSSFKTLLTQIRVQKAKEMLAGDPRLPITEVAMSVGFFDLSHFEKSFRRLVGQSPRDFRRGSLNLEATSPFYA